VRKECGERSQASIPTNELKAVGGDCHKRSSGHDPKGKSCFAQRGEGEITKIFSVTSGRIDHELHTRLRRAVCTYVYMVKEESVMQNPFHRLRNSS
jgi:hypothetical protein